VLFRDLSGLQCMQIRTVTSYLHAMLDSS